MDFALWMTITTVVGVVAWWWGWASNGGDDAWRMRSRAIENRFDLLQCAGFLREIDARMKAIDEAEAKGDFTMYDEGRAEGTIRGLVDVLRSSIEQGKVVADRVKERGSL